MVVYTERNNYQVPVWIDSPFPIPTSVVHIPLKNEISGLFPESEVNHLPPLLSRLRMSEAICLLPLFLHDMDRVNFTFTFLDFLWKSSLCYPVCGKNPVPFLQNMDKMQHWRWESYVFVKLTVPQPVKEFSAFNGTLKFITTHKIY
jgi:hypothetical protein